MPERTASPCAAFSIVSELEESLVTIFQDMLGLQDVGLADSFFELGGNSLIATQILSRVREKYEVDLPLERLLNNPTVDELSKQIGIFWALRRTKQSASHSEESRETFTL